MQRNGHEHARDARRADAEELGYPAFATNNTTRVGGADPAANAAGVALAAFPSTDAGPAARRGDVGRRRRLAAAAIAASVLMAAPVERRS